MLPSRNEVMDPKVQAFYDALGVKNKREMAEELKKIVQPYSSYAVMVSQVRQPIQEKENTLYIFMGKGSQLKCAMKSGKIKDFQGDLESELRNQCIRAGGKHAILSDTRTMNRGVAGLTQAVLEQAIREKKIPVRPHREEVLNYLKNLTLANGIPVTETNFSDYVTEQLRSVSESSTLSPNPKFIGLFLAMKGRESSLFENVDGAIRLSPAIASYVTPAVRDLLQRNIPDVELKVPEAPKAIIPLGAASEQVQAMLGLDEAVPTPVRQASLPTPRKIGEKKVIVPQMPVSFSESSEVSVQSTRASSSETPKSHQKFGIRLPGLASGNFSNAQISANSGFENSKLRTSDFTSNPMARSQKSAGVAETEDSKPKMTMVQQRAQAFGGSGISVKSSDSTLSTTPKVQIRPSNPKQTFKREAGGTDAASSIGESKPGWNNDVKKGLALSSNLRESRREGDLDSTISSLDYASVVSTNSITRKKIKAPLDMGKPNPLASRSRSVIAPSSSSNSNNSLDALHYRVLKELTQRTIAVQEILMPSWEAINNDPEAIDTNHNSQLKKLYEKILDRVAQELENQKQLPRDLNKRAPFLEQRMLLVISLEENAKELVNVYDEFLKEKEWEQQKRERLELTQQWSEYFPNCIRQWNDLSEQAKKIEKNLSVFRMIRLAKHREIEKISGELEKENIKTQWNTLSNSLDDSMTLITEKVVALLGKIVEEEAALDRLLHQEVPEILDEEQKSLRQQRLEIAREDVRTLVGDVRLLEEKIQETFAIIDQVINEEQEAQFQSQKQNDVVLISEPEKSISSEAPTVNLHVLRKKKREKALLIEEDLASSIDLSASEAGEEKPAAVSNAAKKRRPPPVPSQTTENSEKFDFAKTLEFFVNRERLNAALSSHVKLPSTPPVVEELTRISPVAPIPKRRAPAIPSKPSDSPIFDNDHEVPEMLDGADDSDVGNEFSALNLHELGSNQEEANSEKQGFGKPQLASRKLPKSPKPIPGAVASIDEDNVSALTQVHEDSSTKSTNKLSSKIEFPKRSNEEIEVDDAVGDWDTVFSSDDVSESEIHSTLQVSMHTNPMMPTEIDQSVRAAAAPAVPASSEPSDASDSTFEAPLRNKPKRTETVRNWFGNLFSDVICCTQLPLVRLPVLPHWNRNSVDREDSETSDGFEFNQVFEEEDEIASIAESNREENPLMLQQEIVRLRRELLNSRQREEELQLAMQRMSEQRLNMPRHASWPGNFPQERSRFSFDLSMARRAFSFDGGSPQSLPKYVDPRLQRLEDLTLYGKALDQNFFLENIKKCLWSYKRDFGDESKRVLTEGFWKKYGFYGKSKEGETKILGMMHEVSDVLNTRCTRDVVMLAQILEKKVFLLLGYITHKETLLNKASETLEDASEAMRDLPPVQRRYYEKMLREKSAQYETLDSYWKEKYGALRPNVSVRNANERTLISDYQYLVDSSEPLKVAPFVQKLMIQIQLAAHHDVTLSTNNQLMYRKTTLMSVGEWTKKLKLSPEEWIKFGPRWSVKDEEEKRVSRLTAPDQLEVVTRHAEQSDEVVSAYTEIGNTHTEGVLLGDSNNLKVRKIHAETILEAIIGRLSQSEYWPSKSHKIEIVPQDDRCLAYMMGALISLGVEFDSIHVVLDSNLKSWHVPCPAMMPEKFYSKAMGRQEEKKIDLHDPNSRMVKEFVDALVGGKSAHCKTPQDVSEIVAARTKVHHMRTANEHMKAFVKGRESDDWESVVSVVEAKGNSRVQVRGLLSE